MPIIDWPLERLQEYRPEPRKPADLDRFWEGTLTEARRAALNPAIEPIEYPVGGLNARRVFFDGWRGARICAWFLSPSGAKARPTLVFYHGYSGNKGQIYDYLGWVLQGYTVMAVDTRGQSGDSTDPGDYPSGHVKGWMTEGITSPETYYYRAAYADCVRALDFARAQPEVDANRIGVTGGSQGGGLSLAVAALDGKVALAMPDIPFLCHFRRALEVTEADPYYEISLYINRYPDREGAVYNTLSYVDNLNLADRITCPVLMSVGLRDQITPPSTIFATYNNLPVAEKELRIYPYGGHEGYPTHAVHKLAWARKVLRPEE